MARRSKIQVVNRTDFVTPRPQYVVYNNQKSYGCLGFLGDVFMTIITCGLWLIWIFVREMRR